MRETPFDPEQFREFYQQEKRKLEELSKKYKLPVTIYFGRGHTAKFE